MKLSKEEIKVPKGVSVDLQNGTISVKGQRGELNKELKHPNIKIEKINDSIFISAKTKRRRDKALVGTYSAHLRNMIRGVSQGFEYKMKIVFAHFPIKASMRGNEFIVENFLGEKTPRKITLDKDVKVIISGENVILQGIDIEKVGQTAANIEKLTKIKDRDLRVFQDGIYIVSKGD